MVSRDGQPCPALLFRRSGLLPRRHVCPCPRDIGTCVPARWGREHGCSVPVLPPQAPAHSGGGAGRAPQTEDADPGRLTGHRLSWACSGPRPKARDASGRALGPRGPPCGDRFLCGAGEAAERWPREARRTQRPLARPLLSPRPDPSAGGAPCGRGRGHGAGRSRTSRAG